MRIEWHTLTELAKDKFKVVPSDPGIYVARWSKEGKAVPIDRLANSDSKGILYIGSAKNLKNRIRKLCGGIKRESKGHTIFKTILFCKVFEAISPSEYEISWEKLKTHKEAKGQEGAALKAYLACGTIPQKKVPFATKKEKRILDNLKSLIASFNLERIWLS